MFKRKFNKIKNELLELSEVKSAYGLMLADKQFYGTSNAVDRITKIINIINENKKALLSYKKTNFKEIFAQICYKLGFHVLINEDFYNLLDELFDYDCSYYSRSFIRYLISTMGYRVYNYDKIIPYCNKYLENFNESSILFNKDELIDDFEKATKAYPNKVRFVEPWLVEDKVQEYAKYIEKCKELNKSQLEEKPAGPTKEEIEIAKKNYKKKVDIASEIKTYSNGIDYPLCSKTVYNFDEEFSKTSLDDYINKINNSTEEELTSLIVNECNLVALLAYIVKAIDNKKHNSDLNPNIDYILNNVSMIFKGKEEQSNQIPFVILVKYLAYTYGICYKADYTYAYEYLKSYCSLLKEDSGLKPLEILGVFGVKALHNITSLTHLFINHLSYKELIMNISNPSKVLPYKMLCCYIEELKEKDHADVPLKLIDSFKEIHIKEIMQEKYEKYYKESSNAVYNKWYNEKREKELLEEKEKEEKEFNEIVAKVKELIASQLKKEENNKPLEQLLKEYDNPESIQTIASYYFHEAIYEYKLYYKSASYYEKLNVSIAKINTGICFSNIHNISVDEKEKNETLQLALDIFLAEGENSPLASMLFMFKSFFSERDYGDIASKLYSLHKEKKDNSELINLWLDIAYLFYQGKILDSITILRDNLLKLWHNSLLDHYLLALSAFFEKRNKLEYGYRIANKKSAIFTSYDIEKIKKKYAFILKVFTEFNELKYKNEYAANVINNHIFSDYDFRKAYEYAKFAHENNPKNERYEKNYKYLRERLLIK